MTEMIESFATMLLADSFWSCWEDNEFVIDLITYEERNKFRQSYAGSGCEITQGMKDAVCDLEMDLKQFLPLEMTQEIVLRVDKFWKGKYSVEQLHEYCERASHRLILGQIGHGVDADDDTHIAEMFDELGIETPRSSHEGAYEQGENLARKVEEILAQTYGHKWINCSTAKYDILILVQNVDGQAYFSVKATNLQTFKSSWVTDAHCIVSATEGSKWKDEFADWEMTPEEALQKMQIIQEKIQNSAEFRESLHNELGTDEEEFEWD